MFFATSDDRNCVCLFKKAKLHEEALEETWQFTGKVISHHVEITSICFGTSYEGDDTVRHRLFSVGRDRKCFEYLVHEARQNSKLPTNNGTPFAIEVEAVPTACIWYPAKDSKEDLLLTANDEYKMKLWNPAT